MRTLDGLDTEPLTGPAEFTEDALALEFTRQHQDGLRYVHEWGKWLRWDGGRWAPDRTIAVHNLARTLVRRLDIAGPKIRARAHAAATVNAIVSLARVDPVHARVPEDFDADPWLLNTPDGTIDLRVGTSRPADRRDGITKITTVAPAPGAARAPTWTACLDTWTRSNADLKAFLQRLCGYWLTGCVREEKLAILYGPGGNGKTRFIETVRACLGPDYATGLTMDTLMVTHGDQHPTDVADLRGRRLAIATETEDGRRLAESRIKHLTGGDRLRARHMRQDFFEFAPTHKIVIVGNHRPGLRTVDEAIRRRVLLIPFDAVIPAEKRDFQLAEKLAAEQPAILAWMTAGCRQWLAQGLQPPEAVVAATEDYLASADALGRWLEECCRLAPNETMTKARAFESWQAWAMAAGEFVGTKRQLEERLSRLPGIDEGRLGKGRDRAFIGVGLRSEEAGGG